jgi:uncharacterized coiled-coil DUF342 family protein
MCPVLPFPEDPFLLAFSSSNIYGQTHLMGSRLKNEFIRLCESERQVKEERKLIQAEIESLAQKLNYYKAKNAVFDKLREEWDALVKERDSMKRRVEKERRRWKASAAFFP